MKQMKFNFLFIFFIFYNSFVFSQLSFKLTDKNSEHIEFYLISSDDNVKLKSNNGILSLSSDEYMNYKTLVFRLEFKRAIVKRAYTNKIYFTKNPQKTDIYLYFNYIELEKINVLMDKVNKCIYLKERYIDLNDYD